MKNKIQVLAIAIISFSSFASLNAQVLACAPTPVVGYRPYEHNHGHRNSRELERMRHELQEEIRTANILRDRIRIDYDLRDYRAVDADRARLDQVNFRIGDLERAIAYETRESRYERREHRDRDHGRGRR
jgi:hypothetical protein